MPRRSKWEERCMLLIGALEEVRRTANGMHGGAMAAIKIICDRHLGVDPNRKERGSCP